MRNAVLPAATEDDIRVFVVWTRIFDRDTIEAAHRAAEKFGSQALVNHYYDPHQLVGDFIGQGLGAQSGKVAWDVYLFFERGERWEDRMPAPVDWAHQLLGSSWADNEHFFRGNDLSERLRFIVDKLTSGDTPGPN